MTRKIPLKAEVSLMYPKDRSHHGCLCCSCENLTSEQTLTSLYLSRKAWNGKPEATCLYHCPVCDFRFFGRHLNDLEMRAYYSDFLEESYVRERGRDEFFYTQRLCNLDAAWQLSPVRRVALAEALACVGRQTHCGRVLDYGGGNGALIQDLIANRKAVYDLAATPSIDGVERIWEEADLGEACWDVIVCAQVLEHISDPGTLLRRIHSLVAPGGCVYVEVPVQTWRSCCFPGRLRNIVLWFAMKSRLFNRLMDLYSTAFRVKFGILPPLGFNPMREHVNYFTQEALASLGRQAGFEVAFTNLHSWSGIQVVFKKG